MPTSDPTDSTNIIARAVSARFSNRPTLRSETARLLKDGLLEKYPDLEFDPYLTRIALPIPGGAWRLSLLLDEVLEYLASGVKLDLSDQYDRNCFLTNKVPKQMRTGKGFAPWPDMQVISNVILELPSIVYIGLQDALTNYWSDDNNTGISRWQWLGDLLAGVLKTAAVRHVTVDALQAGILAELAEHPDRRQRPGSALQACTLQTTLSKGKRSATLQAPDLLVSCGQTHLLCSLTGRVEAYTSLESFGLAWAKRFQRDFSADVTTWKRFEPDGNIFDLQAALLLNQQLDNLAALKLPANQTLDELQRRIDAITDLARVFVDETPDLHNLVPIQAGLPDWLQTASADNRMAYRQHVLALARTRQQTRGRSFSDGIDDLHTFAKKALHKQMLEDKPQAPGYNADELELTFHVPVGDMGSGYIEKVKMSLTELAIKNLAGKPKGRMTIRHTGNQLIQDWTTEAYLLDLVKRVDVGKHYPQLIDTLLLGHSTETRERERLFALELAIQLPLQALEHSIRGEHGFNRLGYRYVNALMKGSSTDRLVEGQAIVIRPLAFQRKADAAIDTVANMFVIEAKDLNAEGPHILYRPLYTPALQQYASRRDLFKAIALPGPLQDSVLTWLTDRTRPIYANNGFNEPHIRHFHIGDEFPSFEKPAPAILVGNAAAAEWLKAVEENRVLRSLFVSNAQALVQFADQQAVSNAESRWAIMLEGGWLIFNLLLLPLRGPAMIVGWMLQLTHSLINDIPALDSDDATTRNQAWTDLLLNIGLVVLHVAKESSSAALPGSVDRVVPLALEPLRHPYPSPFDPVVREEAPGLPSAPPGDGNTVLDFNFSTARDSTSARLLDTFREMHVPWPTPLPSPTTTGPFKGLYLIANEWHASLAGLLFRVRIVPGFGEVYLFHPDHPGIKLRSNGQGQWRLDHGLKLGGGGPKARISKQRDQKNRRIEKLDENYDNFIAQQAGAQARVDFAEQLMNRTGITEPERTRLRQLFSAKLEQQTETYLQQIAEQKEIAELKKTDPDVSRIRPLLRNSINNLRKQIVMADLDRRAIIVKYREFNINRDQTSVALLTGGDAMRNRYLEFLRETSTVNETMIKLYDEVEIRLQELKKIPDKTTPSAWEQLTSGRPEELTALRLRAFQLGVLRPLSIKTLEFETVVGLDDAVEPVVVLSRSHSDLQGLEVFDSKERIAVFDNLVERYGKAQDALESIGIFNSEELEPSNFSRLREIIVELRNDAERRLADELQQLPEPPESPAPQAGSSTAAAKPAKPAKPARPVRPRASHKRVIKTDTKGVLIGDLRTPVAGQVTNIVDVRNPMDEGILASFEEKQPDVWKEITPRRADAATVATPYSQLKGYARKALAKVDQEMLKIEGYALRASYPKEIEEQLQREATKLAEFASKLESHVQAPANNEPDARLISQLRDKATVINTKAIELRTQMTLAAPPTSEGVEYLLNKKVIYARTDGKRVQLTTGRKDFMQEYTLMVNEDTPLWYAHFHYDNLTDAKANYRRTHLKTKDQRYENYETALAKAADSRQKIDIHRANISDELALIFLPIEPR
ncbi:hypothetical protein PspR84_12275 [Pseudomonas sp. R84]|uniref:dermonecrotic toxin domain-containing protein n=1 Tax=Pseudomonas sp. R84 TaxID=1573712 RepID=UPI00131FAD43|nr:DUF6543 domain-containing protein [Pseudomonas sp. R84]QHC95389.1 hypothetical protein PspR84_12275 [Pseudomonas sp. R84]